MVTEKDLKFMELAIKEAANSEHGSETDPRVGAVVVLGDKLIGSAHRGELGKGDHAEFTLLQKKLRSKDLTSGATLYTTLEPCTTRTHNKKPCTDWVVEKGIHRVVIGILDPNPSICGKAYWRLIDAGVEVDFFPSELAQQIIELNRPFVDKQRRGQAMSFVFEGEIQNRKNITIAPYLGLGYLDALVLQQTPSIREGWALPTVQIRIGESQPFVLPPKYRSRYKQYFQECFRYKGFQDDGEKFMLMRNPVTSTDSPSLLLEVKPTRYSCVQFYRDNIATNSTEKTKLIDDLVQGSLEAQFPHSLCMHMIILTSDNRLLLIKRSQKVSYAPGTWSVSIEEQLAREDFKDGPENVATNWACRLMAEELGLDQASYRVDDLRLLSIFLEADILNISICVYTELQIEANKLALKLQAGVRPDYEHTEFNFLDADGKTILKEILAPTKQYHPTAGLRLLYALLKKYGSPTESQIREVTGKTTVAI